MWAGIFRPTKPALTPSSLECANRRVTENNFCRIVGHTPAMLQNNFARVDSA
jgi:hypothetical protein